MAMTRKTQRLYLVLLALLALGGATALMLTAFNDTMVYFYSPTDIKTKQIAPERRIRVGGLVQTGSVSKDGGTTHFIITDTAESVMVTFVGVLPDLFREGQGVVAEGKLDPLGHFQASEVLAKHDEKYMPKEVADALKKSGRWQEGKGDATKPPQQTGGGQPNGY